MYVIGGIAGDTILSSVERYDPATNHWTSVAPLPEPLHHTAAAAIEDSIYVIGGYRTLRFDPTTSVYRYDAALDRWTAVAPLPSARGAHAAASIDGTIYVAGGFPTLTSLVAYDATMDRWTTLASMPTAREHLGAAANGGKLYVAAGRAGGNVAAFETYDPATNRWTSLPPVPTARSGIAVASVGERVYVFGGEGNPNTPTGVFREAQSYDVTSGVWRTEPPMPTPRHGIGAAVVDGVIYIPAGATVQGFGTSTAHDALITRPLPKRRAVGR